METVILKRAKDRLLSAYDEILEDSKICLAIKMPDGSVELIINSNVKSKLDYIRNSYDDNLCLKANSVIQIINYMIY